LQLHGPIYIDSVISRSIDVFSLADDDLRLSRAFYLRGCIRIEHLHDTACAVSDAENAKRIAERRGYKAEAAKAIALLRSIRNSVGDSTLARHYVESALRDSKHRAHVTAVADSGCSCVHNTAISLVVLMALVVVVVVAFRLQRRRCSDNGSTLDREEETNITRQELASQRRIDSSERATEPQPLRRSHNAAAARNHDVIRRGEDNYKKIIAGEKATMWNKEDFICFSEYYTNTHHRMISKYGDGLQALTPTQLFMLCLHDMHISDSRICDILGISRGSLRTARSRIRKRVSR
jgi:DNA-binding CsgD family transcriptional regulator